LANLSPDVLMMTIFGFDAGRGKQAFTDEFGSPLGEEAAACAAEGLPAFLFGDSERDAQGFDILEFCGGSFFARRRSARLD